MELFIILLKGLTLLIGVLLMIIGLASVLVFIYLQFISYQVEFSEEEKEDSLPIENKQN